MSEFQSQAADRANALRLGAERKRVLACSSVSTGAAFLFALEFKLTQPPRACRVSARRCGRRSPHCDVHTRLVLHDTMGSKCPSALEAGKATPVSDKSWPTARRVRSLSSA